MWISQMFNELNSSPFVPTLWFLRYFQSLSSHQLAAYCIVLQYHDIPNLQINVASDQCTMAIDFEHMETLAHCPTPFGFECAEIMEELSYDPETYEQEQCHDSLTGHGDELLEYE